MESKTIKRSNPRKQVGKHAFEFLHKFKKVEHIEVYDSDKLLVLVGMDKGKVFNHVIIFNRYSIELDVSISLKSHKDQQN